MAQLTLSVVPETQGFFSTLVHFGPKGSLNSHLKFFLQTRFFLCNNVKTIWKKWMAMDRGWYQRVMCVGHFCFNIYLLKWFWHCFMLAEFCFAPPTYHNIYKNFEMKGTVKIGCGSNELFIPFSVFCFL